MRGVSRRLVIAAALSGVPLMPAARAATPEQIGSWTLDCPSHDSAAGCVLRDRDWFVPPIGGHPGVALEVQVRGDRLVPVVAVRGLSAPAAVGGLLALKPQVTLRLDPGPRADLACGLDGEAIVCAPEGASVAAAAAALPTARAAEVQVVLNGPGTSTFPAPASKLDLQGTREALARFRAAGPPGETLPAEPGLDWVGFVDRVLQAAGFRNGATALVPRLTNAVGGGRG